MRRKKKRGTGITVGEAGRGTVTVYRKGRKPRTYKNVSKSSQNRAKRIPARIKRGR